MWQAEFKVLLLQCHAQMPNKLPGDACTPNGGLKEAHEISWVNDPDNDDTAMTTKSMECG